MTWTASKFEGRILLGVEDTACVAVVFTPAVRNDENDDGHDEHDQLDGRNGHRECV